MKKTMTSTVCFILFICVSSGCVTRLGDLTIMSTKNVEIESGSRYVETDEPRCEGNDMKLMILFIPTGQPNIEEAVDKCIESREGDLLTNAVLKSKFFYFIIGQFGYNIRGDVFKLASTADLLNPDKEIYRLASTPTGLKLISEQNSQMAYDVFEAGNRESYSIE